MQCKLKVQLVILPLAVYFYARWLVGPRFTTLRGFRVGCIIWNYCILAAFLRTGMEDFFSISLSLKKRKLCFPRSLVSFFHCLCCGELGIWSLDICTIKLVGFLLTCKDALGLETRQSTCKTIICIQQYFLMLREQLFLKKKLELKVKTERKWLLLLIPFLKIMPKIKFRLESFPKFKHLLTQWNNSEVCV